MHHGKKLMLVVALIMVLGVVLGGCSSHTQVSTQTQTFSWDGTWVDPAQNMVAQISDDTIEINVVDGDTSGLYWKGTWPVVETVSDGLVIVSQGDDEAMSESFFGSSDGTKTFVYDDKELSFPFRVLGITTTLYLKKKG
jgi:hypothetical protein